MKTHAQFLNRGFSRTHFANECDPFSRRNSEADLLDCGRCLACVGKGDIAKFNGATQATAM